MLFYVMYVSFSGNFDPQHRIYLQYKVSNDQELMQSEPKIKKYAKFRN